MRYINIAAVTMTSGEIMRITEIIKRPLIIGRLTRLPRYTMPAH